MFRNPDLAEEGYLSPQKSGAYVYIGPDGVPLTPSDLPAANTTRWVIRRKAIVAGAIETGLIDLDDACRRYNLSVEELTAWRQALKEFGPAGLMTTKRHRSVLERPKSELGGSGRAMKASKLSDAQKAFILKQGADGVPVDEICRKAGISQATYFNWKKKYDGLLPTEMRRLKLLEDENAKLRKVVADLSLDKEMLQDALRRKI